MSGEHYSALVELVFGWVSSRRLLWTLRLAVLGLFPVLAISSAADFYVDPQAKATGKGTVAEPWQLATALAHPPSLKPGDTIYLREGTYPAPDRLLLYSKLNGAAGKPVTVRPYPGEHAAIDGGLQISGSWVVFRDLEILNSRTVRRSTQTGSAPSDILQPAGITVLSPNVKIINNIVHDTSTGLASWKDASDNEFYGNIVYYNGWDAPDRGHGHGAYMQNRAGTKYLIDNIVFNMFEIGLQIYGSSATELNNFHLEGNIVFNSGVMAGHYSRNLFIGGGVVANNPVLKSNFTYYPTSWNHGGDNNIGAYGGGKGCTNLVLENNYLVSGGIALTLNQCTISSFRDNTLFGELRNFSAASHPQNSFLLRKRPAGAKVFVRPNRYETGRAHIAVYNWDQAASVEADLSGIGLAPGDTFEIRDAQNFFGPPVLTAAYTGAKISIPMNSVAVATPVGNVPYSPVHTTAEFGAFVVLKKTGNPALPSIPGPEPPVPQPEPEPPAPEPADPTTPEPPASPIPSTPAFPISVYSAWMEAENGARSNFPIVNDTTVSGRKYIQTQAAANSQVTFNVSVPASGTYYLWLRVVAPSQNSSQIGISLDSGPEDICDLAYGAWASSWQWVRANGRDGKTPLTLSPRPFAIEKAGWHKLYLRSKQEGVKIDGFIITNNPALVPTDAAFTSIR